MLRVKDWSSGEETRQCLVYVGIDVHRKRSQVAVVTEDGTVQLNKKRGERLRADAAADR
jgi:hypothetical protein